MDSTEIIERLTIGCRILAEQNIVDAYGHLSARVPGRDDLFIINRGMSPALVVPEDFLVMDLEGNVVEGTGVPNAEWFIHACVYRSRPDVGSVLHTHSMMSRIFSLSPVKLRGVLLTDVGEWNAGLPVYRRPGLVTSRQAGEELATTLGQGSAALLRGHGDVVALPDVTRTVMGAVRLKQNAEALHGVLQHGEPDYWNDAEAAIWAQPLHASLSPEARQALANRIWDYYEARVTGRLAELLRQGVPDQ